MYRVDIELKVKLDHVSLQTFINHLLAERNTSHFTIGSYSWHCFLAVHAFVNNCSHQKSLRAYQEQQPLALDQSDALVSKSQAECPTSFVFSIVLFFICFNIQNYKNRFCYLYTLTITYILSAVQDNSSSLNAAQASQKDGHACFRVLQQEFLMRCFLQTQFPRIFHLHCFSGLSGWREVQHSLCVMKAGQFPCCLWLQSYFSPAVGCFLPLRLRFVLFHWCAYENNASCATQMCAKPLCIQRDNRCDLCLQYVQADSTSSIQTLLSAYQAGMECPMWK